MTVAETVLFLSILTYGALMWWVWKVVAAAAVREFKAANPEGFTRLWTVIQILAGGMSLFWMIAVTTLLVLAVQPKGL